MMSISNLFDSGFKTRNKSHFAAIVRVAMGDGQITDDERSFLERLAKNLDVSEAEFNKILKNYNDYPINPPVTLERRIERLFDLVRMVYADGFHQKNQLKVVTKLCVGLGFDLKKVDEIAEKSSMLAKYDIDFESFEKNIYEVLSNK